MSKDELEQIGQRAAALCGQSWDAIPAHSREAWCRIVQDVTPDAVTGTPSEIAAAQALREFHAGERNGQTAPTTKEEAPQGKVDKTVAKAALKVKK
jgi:hypothetical protein